MCLVFCSKCFSNRSSYFLEAQRYHCDSLVIKCFDLFESKRTTRSTPTLKLSVILVFASSLYLDNY